MQKSNCQDPNPSSGVSKPSPLSHHILCAGRFGVAFARFSAATLRSGCPVQLRDKLRIFIHLDAMTDREAREAATWLAEEPCVRPTYGLFGIRNPRKAINWHQRMINRVVDLFASEPLIAFVDADLFVSDPAWWKIAVTPAPPQSMFLYAQTHGLRKERRLSLGNHTFFGMKTALFTVNPTLHKAINTQRVNSDVAAAKRLSREFPCAQLEVGKFVDTMVVVSLRAQALGYTLEDLSQRVEVCHVGGFSHISLKKLIDGESTVGRDNWLRRLRLFESVVAVLQSRGWGRWLNPEHLEKVRVMREKIEAEPTLKEVFLSLKHSPDERIFEKLAQPRDAVPSDPHQ